MLHDLLSVEFPDVILMMQGESCQNCPFTELPVSVYDLMFTPLG